MSTVENSETMEEQTPDPVETPDLANKWLKLRIAELARLMGDNQRVLDSSNAQLEQDRDFERRLTESFAKQRFGDDWIMPEDKQGGSDEMKIAIDSPTTINYTTQPVTPPPVAATESKAAGVGKGALLAATLAAAGLGGGLGIGIPWMLGAFDKPESATFTDTDTDTQYRLELEGSQ